MRNIHLPTALHPIYIKRYLALIQSAENQITNEYCEVHHILPKCMNGLDDTENLISLTARQHFIAHRLLWKAYQTTELTNAFWSMCHQKKTGQEKRYTKINSRTYAILKEQRSKIIKKTNSDRWLDENWANNMRNTLSKAASTPAEKLRRSKQATYNNELNKKKLSEDHTARWKDTEWAEKVCKKMIENNTRRKAISVDGITYSGAKEVAEKFNITKPAVRFRIKSEYFTEWKYA